MSPQTPEFWRTIAQAGDQPVEIVDPNTNTAYVVVSVESYNRLRAFEDEARDREEHIAWARLGRKARSDWAGENPY